MGKKPKNPRALTVLLAIGMLSLIVQISLAQESAKFAEKGCVELGGNITFLSTTPVDNGSTRPAYSVFSFGPFIGIFAANGFEIGMYPEIVTSSSSGFSSTTSIMFFAAPSYNFTTNGKAYPFIEALLGYTSASSGSSSASGFSWGVRGGIKVVVTDKALLNVALQYVQITLNPSGATGRYGSNQFSFSVGFSIWL